MTEGTRLALSLAALVLAFCIGVGIVVIAADPAKHDKGQAR